MAFVESRPEATPFHHPRWSTLIADCYGFHGFVFALCGVEGEIIAGLPIVEVGRRRRWVSMAFTDYCGPLGSVEACKRLIAALDVRRLGERISSVEIRSAVSEHVKSTIVGFRHQLTLDAEPTEISSRFRLDVRRGIKKAEREGIRVRFGSTREDLAAFYVMHLRTRRRLGVPIQPRAFFDRLWEGVIQPGLGVVFVAELDEVPLAAAVFLGYQNMLIYKFGASERSGWSYRPNHALLWNAIQWGCGNGFALLDFGRTDLDNQGLREFKAHWGTTESQLIYSVLGRGRVSQSNSTALRALGVAIRHSPEGVCRQIGEHLYRYVP